VAWQNSDDIYYQGAFNKIAQKIMRNEKADIIIADINLIDENDMVIREQRYAKPSYNAMIAEGMVLANQAVFWRRTLHDRIGWINETLHYGFDYEWFLRLLKESNRVVHLPAILGALRYHDLSKTSLGQPSFQEEYQLILKGHVFPVWKRMGYQALRMAQLLKLGHWNYVMRGMKRRLIGSHR
jgi:hypothetical protein